MYMLEFVRLLLKKTSFIVLFSLIFLHAAWSQELQNTVPEIKIDMRMKNLINTHVRIIDQWVENPKIISLLIESNKELISIEEIKNRDQDWIQGSDTRLYEQLKDSLTSQILKAKIINSKVYVEAFVCDQQGVIVALYPKSSDYWQGDEAKFINSFNQGQGTVFIDELSFDESTNMHSVHVSIPIFHDNTTIGVLIVGIKNIKAGNI